MDKDIERMMDLLIEREKTHVVKYKCFRCNHIWNPKAKNGKPVLCPRCKARFWDKPSKRSIVDYLSNLIK